MFINISRSVSILKQIFSSSVDRHIHHHPIHTHSSSSFLFQIPLKCLDLLLCSLNFFLARCKIRIDDINLSWMDCLHSFEPYLLEVFYFISKTLLILEIRIRSV